MKPLDIPPTMTDTQSPAVRDRSIGDIIRDLRNLSAENVQAILAYQQEHQVRFGEAAVKLGFATNEDVMVALAQQFHYPYDPAEGRQLSDELVTLRNPFSAHAEAFRAIRTRVLMRQPETPGQPRPAVAVVSPDQGDGKSYFAANLAVALAQMGQRTLLLDADMRQPRQHEIFKVETSAGLSNLLAGRTGLQAVQSVEGLHDLYVLPAGSPPPNPLELLERPGLALLMRELVQKFDHVIVDTPAAVHGADAVAVAARCGSALVVARRNQSRLVSLRELTSALAFGSTSLVGLVYNEY